MRSPSKRCLASLRSRFQTVDDRWFLEPDLAVIEANLDSETTHGGGDLDDGYELPHVENLRTCSTKLA